MYTGSSAPYVLSPLQTAEPHGSHTGPQCHLKLHTSLCSPPAAVPPYAPHADAAHGLRVQQRPVLRVHEFQCAILQQQQRSCLGKGGSGGCSTPSRRWGAVERVWDGRGGTRGALGSLTSPQVLGGPSRDPESCRMQALTAPLLRPGPSSSSRSCTQPRERTGRPWGKGGNASQWGMCGAGCVRQGLWGRDGGGQGGRGLVRGSPSSQAVTRPLTAPVCTAPGPRGGPHGQAWPMPLPRR